MKISMAWHSLLKWYLVLQLLAHVDSEKICSSSSTQPPKRCSSSEILLPELPGLKIQNLTASLVNNVTNLNTQFGEYVDGSLITVYNFCNVTVTYTHPGKNDTINVWTWLPMKGWNCRFQAAGGAAFSTGSEEATNTGPLNLNYAVATTDGGHSQFAFLDSTWVLNSDGTINTILAEDFASVALHDLAVIGKAVTTAFYKKRPHYSYFTGCSTGGRQGLMLAQRYPKDFDGILALSPAINWDTLLLAQYWPQIVMKNISTYPPLCELEAINIAAIKSCDGLDGVLDDIISAPGLCNFDPSSLVGKSFNCSGTTRTFTNASAFIAQEIWKGAHYPKGRRIWYGSNPGSSFLYLANTTCSGGLCSPVPFFGSINWIDIWLKRNASFDLNSLALDQYYALFKQSHDMYHKLIGTSNPDLSAFRSTGGKMITWHGLADSEIFPNGSSYYYEQVLARDPCAQEFYRYFEPPGTVHCTPGNGPYPVNVLQDLIKWVEKGEAPETLDAGVKDASGNITIQREICQWPLVSKYKGNNADINSPESFECSSSF